MEERALKNKKHIISQQQVTCQISSHIQQRPSSTKSASPIRSNLMLYDTMPFSASCRNVNFVGINKDKKEHTRRTRQTLRLRPKSPHPVDLMKGAASTDVMEIKQNDERISVGPSHPNFTLSDSLGSSENAEDLRKLIVALETEFRRLRYSKLKAEAKAAKLETDLVIQRQEMEMRFESLFKENELLKRSQIDSQAKLEAMMKKMNKSND